MDLNIFFALLFTLFTGGHSLKCYACIGEVGSCVKKETTCLTQTNTCASATVLQFVGDNSVMMETKACDVTQNCVNGSFNLGNLVARTDISMQCCNTDLCNSRDVPDYSSNDPNGKQCYYCNGKGCWNRLNCLGNEDYCIKATIHNPYLPETVKGCATKSMCDDDASQLTEDFLDFSCCLGNLCNGAKSITQNLLFLLWSFFFYILIH